jgi:hypothetical protein
VTDAEIPHKFKINLKEILKEFGVIMVGSTYLMDSV